MKKLMPLFFALVCIFAVFPSAVFAHETWFVRQIPAGMTVPPLFSSWNFLNESMVAAAFFGFIAALLIHFAMRPHAWTRRMRAFFSHFEPWVSPILRTLTGVLLFSGSLLGFIWAPDLVIANFPFATARALLTTELILGLGLIMGLFPRFLGVAGIIFYLISLFIFPFPAVIGYIFFLGIFAYLAIVGDPTIPKTHMGNFFPNTAKFFDFSKYKPYAMAILRIFFGLSFVIVAVHFKVYEPRYALEFVRQHNVNFMPALGFSYFSNDLFVLSAGLTEIVLGLLVVFGLLPRFVGAFLIIMFTLTLCIFGIAELIGHLPLYAAAFAMLVYGGGKKWSAEIS